MGIEKIIKLILFFSAGVGMTSKMSKKDLKEFLKSMQNEMDKFVEVFKALPRCVMLILRNKYFFFRKFQN